MDLNQIFANFNINETWTGIVLSQDRYLFLDSTDFPPAYRTKVDNINFYQLDKSTYGENNGILLRRVQEPSQYQFEYVPVLKTEQYPALCMAKIPYNRKKSSISAIKSMQKSFIASADSMLRGIRTTKTQVVNVLKTLPKLPANISVESGKEFSMETTLETDILLLDLDQYRVKDIIENMYEETDISRAFLSHSMFMDAVSRLEVAIATPLLHPVAFIKEEWQNEIKQNSTLTLYSKEDNEEELVLVLNSPDEYFTVDNVNRRIVKKDIQSTTTTISSTGNTISSTTPSSTMTTSSTVSSTSEQISAFSTTSPNPVGVTTTDFFSGIYNMWNPSNSTSTSTTTTTTTVSPTTTANMTTEKLPAESWYDRMVRAVLKIRTFADFLGSSWGMLTIYDIVLGFIVFIHSKLLGVLLYLRGGPTRLASVRKTTLTPRFFQRIFGRSRETNDQNMSTLAPESTELQDIVIHSKRGSRRVSYADFATDSDGESQPLNTGRKQMVKVVKRLAPPVPSAPSPTPTPNVNMGTVKGRRTIRRVYLESNLPLYLADSDQSN
jgi:hypothetical protein